MIFCFTSRLMVFASLLLTLSVYTGADAQPCIPSYVNGCSTGIGLNSIYFNGSSTSALTDLNTGCGGTNGYDDRTAISVTMNPGTAPNATFNTISGTANMQAWIDFNNDGAFSSSESIGGANGFTSSGTFTTLTIPSGAATGTHILRFSVTASASYPNINPCPTGTMYTSGETHDYTVHIGSPSAPCTAVTGLAAGNIKSNSATISWSAVTGSAGYEYVVNQTAGDPTGAGTAVPTASSVVNALSPNATYYVHVRNKCNTGLFSGWVTKSFKTSSAAAVAAINSSNSKLTAFPNPASRRLQINITGSPAGNAVIHITDIAGRLFKIIPVRAAQVFVDMQDAVPGFYFLKYADDQTSDVIRIAKQ